MNAVTSIKLGGLVVVSVVIGGTAVPGVLCGLPTPAIPVYSGVNRLSGIWYNGDTNNVGYRDGLGAQAKFYGINGSCIGTDGFLYVSEFGPENQPFAALVPANERGQVIRKIDRVTGYTTTLAGLAGQDGLVDGDASTAKFGGLVALYPQATGLLVADYTNSAIRFVTYAGVVSTIKTGLPGANGVCADTAGNIYVAEYDTGTIKKIANDGPRTVTTIASLGGVANVINPDDSTLIAISFGGGTVQSVDIATGTLTQLASGFAMPNGIAKDATHLYFITANEQRVYSMLLAAPNTVTALAGRSYTATDPDTDFYGLACVACDSTHLYIGEFYGGRIVKISKP
jgi:hypothetical protein